MPKYQQDNPRRVYSPVPPPSFHTGRSGASSDMYTYTTDTNTTDPEYGDRAGCGTWAKYGIFTANIVFMIVGGLLLAMGIWFRTDSRFRNFISERYTVSRGFRGYKNDFQVPPSCGRRFLGGPNPFCLLLYYNCDGSSDDSGSYARLLRYHWPFSTLSDHLFYGSLFLMVATLSCGIYLLYKKDGLDVELSDALNYMVQHYYMGPGVVQEALDKLQTTFRCCGNAGCSDFRMFRQDIPRSCDIRCDGCHFRIMVALRIGFSVTLIVFSAVVLCQLATICFALYFVFMRKKEIKIIYVEERRRRPSHRLTRDTLRDHDLPFQLQAKQQRKYVKY
uniref:Tetraspanin n=1 Tax=Caenorhabditis tropicalis TaxID=1561998 RepID=A0A1I7TI60_9PELO